MSFTHYLDLLYKVGERVIPERITQSAGAQVSISEDVADSATDYEIAFTMDVSEIKLIYINSSQDVTLETNSGAAPAESLSLQADEPYVWWTGSVYTNLLATDITALFVTNASGAVATIEIECLYDPTP